MVSSIILAKLPDPLQRPGSAMREEDNARNGRAGAPIKPLRSSRDLAIRNHDNK